MKTRYLLALVPLIMWPLEGQCKFTVVDDVASTPSAKSGIDVSLIGEIGQRPTSTAPLHENGNDVPFANALQRITPKGWKGFSRGADTGLRVSWDKGEPWFDALCRVVSKSGNRLVVDWERKTITLFKNEAATKQKAAVQLAESGAKPVEPVPQASPISTRKWAIKASDGSIRGAVTRWANDAGWQLSWEATSELRDTLEGSFTGSFEEAMTWLANSMEKSPAPIQVLFYADNHAVRVVPFGARK